MTRIIVSGSRDWPDRGAVFSALDHASIGSTEPRVVVHGGRGSVDQAAHIWARTSQSWTTEVHPAQWALHGVTAGPIRNQQMIDLGADLLLVFIGPCSKPMCHRPKPHGSHGASGIAEMARKAGIETRRFTATTLSIGSAPAHTRST